MFDVIELLERITDRMRGSGGLLHGKYMSTNSEGTRCYCLVGAFRQEVFPLTANHGDRMLTYRHDLLQRLAAEVWVTVETFDPEGYTKVKAEMDKLISALSCAPNPTEWIFMYNDDHLVPLPEDQPDFPPPSAEARDRAVALLEATITRLKAA